MSRFIKAALWSPDTVNSIPFEMKKLHISTYEKLKLKYTCHLDWLISLMDCCSFLIQEYVCYCIRTEWETQGGFFLSNFLNFEKREQMQSSFNHIFSLWASNFPIFIFPVFASSFKILSYSVFLTVLSACSISLYRALHLHWAKYSVWKLQLSIRLNSVDLGIVHNLMLPSLYRPFCGSVF